MHSSWLVRETIAHRTDLGKTTHVALLDIKKCFDSLWHEGILYKLHEIGLQGKIWRLINLMYKGFRCKVMVNGVISKGSDIDILRGIHQGAPCSMFLFMLFINNLLEELQEVRTGVKLGQHIVSCIAFADDIALLASCKNDLQMMVDIAYLYSLQWHFRFSPTKCVVLAFGKDHERHEHVTMGGHVLKIVSSERHLGSILATVPKEEHRFIEKRISDCEKMCFASLSIGSKTVPVTPKVLSKLYYSACIPKLCYGTEVMEIDDTSLSSMEKFHCKSAKIFQSLPQNACNVGSIATLGWSNISAQIDIQRLLFLWRILQLPMHSMYKKVMIFLIFNRNDRCSGPLANMLKTCYKYGLLETLLESVLSGSYMSMNQWKKMIRCIVIDRYKKDLRRSFYLYDALSQTSSYTLSNKVIAWWIYANWAPWQNKNCSMVIRLLLNTYRLGTSMCKMCNHNNDRLSHIIFACVELEDLRKVCWDQVIKACPPGLMQEMEQMSDDARTIFILNSLNCEYVRDWHNIYDALLGFICTMFYRYYYAW